MEQSSNQHNPENQNNQEPLQFLSQEEIDRQIKIQEMRRIAAINASAGDIEPATFRAEMDNIEGNIRAFEMERLQQESEANVDEGEVPLDSFDPSLNEPEALSDRDEGSTELFDAFNELARVNDTLAAIDKSMKQLNAMRVEGTITQDEYRAKYEHIFHNDLEYFTNRKKKLEAMISPTEPSGIRKIARGVMDLLRSKKN